MKDIRDYTDIVDDLKKYMKKRDYTQAQMANSLGIGESQVNRWLCRRTGISKAWKRLLRQIVS
jgi:transcriptional regulator with XRE-family HTH domain